MFKSGRNGLYFIPAPTATCRTTRPEAFVQAVLPALEAPDDAAPAALDDSVESPILVDRSRVELPDTAQVAVRAAVPAHDP